MAKTQQGPFDFTYHHIEAPTKQDDEYGREFKKRKLLIDHFDDIETWRDPLLYYLQDNQWHARRKLDGANIRVQWDGEKALWNGKTNAFQCSHGLHEYMDNTFIEEIFEEKFGRDLTVTIFGEHMGPKVQGNELHLEADEVIIYDVNINGFWQPPTNVMEIAEYFGVHTCYDFADGLVITAPLSDLIHQVANGEYVGWEGLVATPAIECRNQKGGRIITKIKNKDYYRG